MSLLRNTASGLRSLFRKKQVTRELDEELNGFLEMAAQEKMQQGISREGALRSVRLERGSSEIAQEVVRSASWESILETAWQDLRFAARMLRKSPGFTFVAILTLALGIGASTSIFSVVDAVLLRPLPYPNPQQIVRVWEQAPDGHRMNLSDPNFEDFLARNNTFASLAVYGYGLSSVSGGSEPVRVNIAVISSGFFNALGVQPFRGRAFTPDEQRLHGTPAVIVGYGYWQKYLHGAADLSHFHLSMEGSDYQVVGVMPRGFDFPADVVAWIPRELDSETPSRTAHNWRALGRLRDGVTVAQARANLGAIAHGIREQYVHDVDLADAAVLPLSDALVGDVRTALLTLLAGVGLLLLVACANVAGLLLARTSARLKELAVRAALGAGRGRFISQFLAESFVLSFAGGTLGILIALWAVKVIPVILPANLPRQQGIAIDGSVLLFALEAMFAVAISLGLFTAWRAGGQDFHEALRAGSRAFTGTPSSHRFRAFLVIGQIATTLVILVGAGLLSRSFLRLISTSPGFSQQNLITMEFSLPVPQGQWGTDESAIARQVHLMDQILARLGALPGVQTVGLAGAVPVAAGDNLADGNFLILNGQKSPTNFEEWTRFAQDPSHVGHALYCVAGEGYFRTLDLPLIRGRIFSDQDQLNSPNVAVISQSLARQRWPDQDPIGQIINFGNMDGRLTPQTIVGIVGDVRAEGLDRPPSSIIYLHYRQRGMNGNSAPTIVLRSSGPPAAILSAARGIFHALVPDSPVKVSTFAEEMGGWLADRRFLLLLVGLFAAVALILAVVGIYGVVAFSVARRTQEIGIRMSLGAPRGSILGLFLSEGARMAALGVLLGVGASLAITRLISTLLFGVSATDPLTFVAVALLLSTVALLASYLPARRATRVDPLIALRFD
jgi:putative ABC transport system permease protein